MLLLLISTFVFLPATYVNTALDLLESFYLSLTKLSTEKFDSGSTANIDYSSSYLLTLGLCCLLCLMFYPGLKIGIQTDL